MEIKIESFETHDIKPYNENEEKPSKMKWIVIGSVIFFLIIVIALIVAVSSGESAADSSFMERSSK